MIEINSTVGRIVSNKENEYLFFSGTSYLGMSSNASFHELINKGFKLLGSNFPTSRISNIRLPIYQEFELFLANFVGLENSLTLSSGFLAGRLVVDLLKNKPNVIYAPRVHPSLWIDEKSYFDSDFIDWSNRIVVNINNGKSKQVTIVSNSLDSLLGQVYDFSFLLKIRKDIQILLVVDDSHGFGILGNSGKGIVQYLPVATNIEFLIVSSLAKSFGVMGGVILSSEKHIKHLKESVYYSASSAISPAFIYAFLHSSKIYENQRKRLFENVNTFASKIGKNCKLNYDLRFPVFFVKQDFIYNVCKEEKIILSSFPYPKNSDSHITRIVINSLHTKSDINRLYESIKLHI